MDQLSPKDFILIRGAKLHNLKNLSVAIPRNQLVVVTGLSGSGKSSLIFDTLFVEAQRMYVESLSAYARQFLGKLQKPPVDSIQGISPAIAIEQRTVGTNPHATVGTVTELCDYLHLLYARIGTTHSPISGQRVQKDSVSDVVAYINQHNEGTKALILYPLEAETPSILGERLRIEQGKGCTRVKQGDALLWIEDLLAGTHTLEIDRPVYGVVDRIVVQKNNLDNQHRIADSVQTAFFEGKGNAVVEVMGVETRHFSDRFERDGMLFETPTVSFFNFNTPNGACKRCTGLGYILGIEDKKVVPNPSLSLRAGAIAPWNSPTMRKWLTPLLEDPLAYAIPVDLPYSSLTADQKQLLWQGTGAFKGIDGFFAFCAKQTEKMQYRVLLARYRGKTTCPDCQGTRIRPDARYVTINQHSIVELLSMPLQELLLFFDTLSLTERETAIVQRVLDEIKSRLGYLMQVGLSYLTLARPVPSLSGGEYQRIKLATALGSPLCGTIYILDEPTVGLHPRDTERLVQILLDLKHQGNSVIVVEHEEQVIHAADSILEIGPEAGSGGGTVVFQGSVQALLAAAHTHTAQYLNGTASVPLPKQRRSWRHSLWIHKAQLHNLQQVTVEIPLQVLTAVTGVSGSGKSSLIKGVLYPLLERHVAQPSVVSVSCDWIDATLTGDLHRIGAVELVNQQALGKSGRSNPATYLGLYDPIRMLFAQTKLSRSRYYQAGHFSFNSQKGQCPSCSGEGTQKIEMQFMADIYLPCETCKGSRFKPEILEVTYKGKNIAEILHMTVDEAAVFFADESVVYRKLCVLQSVGLGYVQLGQSASSLSGGERQRLKLAFHLEKECSDQPMFFVFDEPTTGLHMHDVHKLLVVFQALVQQGHTVVVVEHNMDVIKNADWVIDLGPEGGAAGGAVVFTGTPEALLQCADNHTARYLREKMGRAAGQL
jgi:excinuclease ABC subunit A